VVPIEKSTVAPRASDLLGLRARLGRKEWGKVFPRKQVQPPGEPDLLTFLAAGPAEEE
jgi:hypothetical protein